MGQASGIPRPDVLLNEDPAAFARWLETARPSPVAADEKARILASLPEHGEITRVDRTARRKLAALRSVFAFAGRDTVFETKLVDLPYAAMVLHARTVVIVTGPVLELLQDDEVRALGAHEAAHEYVWEAHEHASRVQDSKLLRDLELTCDGIATMMLLQMGVDPERLASALERVTEFNRRTQGLARNEGNYPAVAERRAFIAAVRAWAVPTRRGITRAR